MEAKKLAALIAAAREVVEYYWEGALEDRRLGMAEPRGVDLDDITPEEAVASAIACNDDILGDLARIVMNTPDPMYLQGLDYQGFENAAPGAGETRLKLWVTDLEREIIREAVRHETDQDHWPEGVADALLAKIDKQAESPDRDVAGICCLCDETIHDDEEWEYSDTGSLKQYHITCKEA